MLVRYLTISAQFSFITTASRRVAPGSTPTASSTQAVAFDSVYNILLSVLLLVSVSFI